MAKKFYAVRRGHKPGIYETWAAAQEQVHAFSGPVYKGFSTREEAEAFMKGLTVEVYRRREQKIARLSTRREAHRRRREARLRRRND